MPSAVRGSPSIPGLSPTVLTGGNSVLFRTSFDNCDISLASMDTEKVTTSHSEDIGVVVNTLEKGRVSPSSLPSADLTGKEVLDFGGDSTLPPPPKLTPEEEKRLYRKIDLRLMPILSLMYLCSFLDRGQFSLNEDKHSILKNSWLT